MKLPPLYPPKQLAHGVVLTETVTHYQEQRSRCAVVTVNGRTTRLGLADTGRCAIDLNAATRTLENIALSAGLTRRLLAECVPEFQLHCQALTQRKRT